MPSALRTYVGVLHVHRRETETDTSLAEVLAAARRHHIDFVVLADDAEAPQERVEGWHDGVLVLRAEEVRTPDGHLIACELRDPIGEQPSLAAAIAAVKEQYGTIVAIHQPANGDSKVSVPSVAWDDADMLELWCFAEEFYARVQPKHLLQALTRPERLIHGPQAKFLRRWDDALMQRRLPVVSGLNVLPQKQPLFDWKVDFSYDNAFRSLCTCLTIPELPSVSLRARDLIWKALREGRSYIVNRGVAAEDAFRFEYKPTKGRPRQMGEEFVYTGNGRFQIEVPDDAEIVLRRNGYPLYWGSGKAIGFPAVGPGSYRLEVYMDRRLWIISNAIRLLEHDGGVELPTVSDVT